MSDFSAPAATAELRTSEAAFVVDYVLVPSIPTAELTIGQPSFVAQILATAVTPAMAVVPLTIGQPSFLNEVMGTEVTPAAALVPLVIGQPSFLAQIMHTEVTPAAAFVPLTSGQPSFAAQILPTEVAPAVAFLPLMAVDASSRLVDHFAPEGAESEFIATDPSFEDFERDLAFDVNAALAQMIPPQASFMMGVATPLAFRPPAAVIFLSPGQPDFVGGDRLARAPQVFPFPWGEDALVETYGYTTDILVSFDGSEQRRQLRQVASGSLQFVCPLLDVREAQRAHALLFASQGRQLVLPRWNYAQPIAQAAGAGSSAVLVPTAFVSFVEGAFALLWRDSAHFELVIVLHVEADRITTTQPLKQTWPAATTLILPCVIGRLGSDEALTWEARGMASSAFEFAVERWTP